MTLVLDASLTLSWYFEDEHTPGGEKVMEHVRDAGAVVPGLWRLEVANGLQIAIRRKRIDAAYRDQALKQLGAMNIMIDEETSHYAWSTTLRLAHRFALTLYDAVYLELAQRRGLPLATLDRDLAAAALGLGLDVISGEG